MGLRAVLLSRKLKRIGWWTQWHCSYNVYTCSHRNVLRCAG